MLGTKGQTRVRIAQLIVELTQKHCPAERYYAGNGDARGRMVSGKDLEGKIVFELVQNSELPVTPFSQQTDVRAMFEAYGGAPLALQVKQQDPEFFKATVAPFNIDWGPENQDDISTLCLSRLDQMKEALAAGVNDPEALVQGLKPPVSVYEPKHGDKRDWWGIYLDLQQGQEAPMEIRLAAEQMWVLHGQYKTRQSMPESVGSGLVQGAGMAAAQAPSALGAMALQQMGGGDGQDQQAQMQHEKDQQAQEHELAATTHVSDQQHELKTKALEGQIQMAVTQQQGQNAIESAKVAGENALKVQNAKPKPKATKAA
jgi:hypothetical protein